MNNGPQPISCRGVRAGYLAVAVVVACCSPGLAELRISPLEFSIDGPETCQQIVVLGVAADGTTVDLTRQVSYDSLDSKVISVDETGLAFPRGEGAIDIRVRHGTETAVVRASVRGLHQPTPVLFEQAVIPILTKARCNSGGCHGKAEGQNGFKLSVFGFDPASDFQSLTQEGRGRRVSPSTPERSLLLRKATASVPHGGGKKIDLDSTRYRLLLRWVTEGAAFTSDPQAVTTAIEVDPRERVLTAHGTQQLRVTAVDVAGRRRCVTAEAEYESNADNIATVDQRGLVRASEIPGEAAILVRYMGQVATCRVTLPRPGVKFTRPPETNFIDRLVWDKLERLGIEPSPLADDATFLRRVFLDTLGTLPTPAEVRGFLSSTETDKRAKLIDRLLDRPEYADYWSMRWADLLRVDQEKVTPQGAYGMTRWLRRQFANNRPYDQFVRDILTVQGSTLSESPAAFYKVLTEPEVLSRSISQVFLGVRIECAQCHHHPYERWGQEDYFGFAGFFTGVGKKNLQGISTPPVEAIVVKAGTDLKHPRTQAVIPARALGAAAADFSKATDRRAVLADWLTAPDNPFFAKTIVNRTWAHYLGRGLVEPIDDLRDTNPASNEPLFLALTQHMRDLKFDLKALTRTVLNSRVYQASAEPTGSNVTDTQNFSHAVDKPLPAEVLLDEICQVTGVPEKFIGWPRGYRAIQVWDSRVPNYFFRIFGRPVRASVCECERSNEPSISQALHLMNSPEIVAKIRDRQGRVRQLADSARPATEIVDELYLATLTRFPTEEERKLILATFPPDNSQRREATEDLLWALLNTKEFIYNH